MNWILLKEPPQDASDYLKSYNLNTPQLSEENLRVRLKTGTSKIKAIGFDVGVIKNLEKEITKNRYKVQVVPSGIPAYADFYLVKV